MSISSKTRKMLWGRGANRCAICRMELVMDETETDDESVVGDECHIVAREDDGPRGESTLTSEQRDKYANLILLCKIHHKNIDDQAGHYTVEMLHQIKNQHEQWVKKSLDIDDDKQREEELYMTFIEKWADLVKLDNWQVWTSWMLGAGDNSILVETEADLQEAKEYLFSRVWPTRYPELNDSFENFRIVLDDLLRVFHEHSEEKHDNYFTYKFYKIKEWDHEKYHALLREYNFHVVLVQDLVIELTRAGNYVCDMIRKFLMPSYRTQEGLLIIGTGPYIDMSFHMHRTQYRGSERINIPYPGLNEFKRIRNTRDFSLGIGVSSEDPVFLESYQ